MTMPNRYRLAAAALWCGLACASAQALPAVGPRMGEQVVMVPANIGGTALQLQTTIYKPPGDGPFPVLFMNHGKAGGDAHKQPRATFPVISREFVKRGYAVVIPMRMGFAGSGGTYVNSHCDAKNNGEQQANSLFFAMQYAMKQPWADQEHVIIAGQSHGGLTAIAAGSHKIAGVRGIINFAGGVNSRSHCDWQAALVDAFKAYGANSTIPSIWFYGANDTHFGPRLAADMYAAYTRAGGKAQLVAYGPFKKDAHSMSSSPDGVAVWWPATERFLQSVGMPTEIKYKD
jgi:dienelactone hydrolase